MIAVIMFTVSLLTIEHDKASAKKDYSSSKDSGNGEGGSDSSSGSEQVRQEKRIPAVIVTAKSLQHMYPLTFRYRYPISHRIKQVSCVLSLKILCHL